MLKFFKNKSTVTPEEIERNKEVSDFIETFGLKAEKETLKWRAVIERKFDLNAEKASSQREQSPAPSVNSQVSEGGFTCICCKIC